MKKIVVPVVLVVSQVAVGATLFASAVRAQPASVEMDEALAKYGPGIFPAVTRMEVCGRFRVLVVHWAGTDMLFVDEVEPALNESTLAVKRGFSIREFNSYEQSTTIRELSCDLQSSRSLRVAGKAHSDHSERDYSFVLEMDPASGKYKYSDTQTHSR